MKTALVVAAAAALSGCVAQSLQLEELQARLAARAAVPVDARSFEWELRFNGARYSVFPVAEGDSFVFRDAGTIEVGFDGLDVTYVRGLPGAVGDMVITRAEAARRIERPGLQPLELACEPLEEVGRGWLTRCTTEVEGRSYPMDYEGRNSPDGSLEALAVMLVPGAGPLMLLRPAGRRTVR